jgi:uncharacterized protein (TIGR00290 family)
MPKTLFHWSGGKDSALALYYLQQKEQAGEVHLFTTAGEATDRVSMHGVRTDLMRQQARSLELPLHWLLLPENLPMPEYERLMADSLGRFRGEGFGISVYGDIFLEDLRAFREKGLAEAGMQAVFPLWKKDSRQLVEEFISLGFKAVVACVNARYMNHSFAGRLLDRSFLNDLPDGIDPCGENGEFHTFVFDGPIFREPVSYRTGDVVYRTYSPAADDNDNCFSNQPARFDTGFWFCDLLPA